MAISIFPVYVCKDVKGMICNLYKSLLSGNILTVFTKRGDNDFLHRFH